MPIENELKTVLSGLSLSDFDATWTIKDIQQGYLEDRCRIRSMVVDNDVSYLFTKKFLVDYKVVEIETEIDRQDFIKLWTITEKTLTKTRISKQIGNELWEVDFFGGIKDPYFIMAECEMPEDQMGYKDMPEFLRDKTIHYVDRGDGVYASKRLCDKKYAQELYKELIK